MASNAEVSYSKLNGPAFTCMFTAALRHTEQSCVPSPILVDPLAKYLCNNKALDLAEKELQSLVKDQGPGKHLRVPARTRLLDDLLLNMVTNFPTGTAVNVVSLGCGMDTRPWRLAMQDHQVTWVDVDQPCIAHLKRQMLLQARAQTNTSPSSSQADSGVDADNDCSGDSSAFMLKVSEYDIHGVDLATTSLNATLAGSKWNPTSPTIWLLEALIYYLPLTAAAGLLHAMAACSVQGSSMILTCVDTELLEASRTRVDSSHVFANLWHFDHHELLSCHEYQTHWETTMQPISTKDLALQTLSAETYVALYGGAECVITADIKQGAA